MSRVFKKSCTQAHLKWLLKNTKSFYRHLENTICIQYADCAYFITNWKCNLPTIFVVGLANRSLNCTGHDFCITKIKSFYCFNCRNIPLTQCVSKSVFILLSKYRVSGKKVPSLNMTISRKVCVCYSKNTRKYPVIQVHYKI